MAIRLVVEDTYIIIEHENLVNDFTMKYYMIGLMYRRRTTVYDRQDDIYIYIYIYIYIDLIILIRRDLSLCNL